jgi:glutaredoxin
MSSTTFASVVVYGKQGCKFCDLAKDKFQRLEIPYDFKLLQPFTEHHEGWRTDGSVELTAAYNLYERTLPIISIDGQFFTYPMAMNFVKTKQAKKIEVKREEPVLAIA